MRKFLTLCLLVAVQPILYAQTPATEFYLQRNDIWVKATASASVDGMGIEVEEITEDYFGFPYTYTVETEVPFDDNSSTTGVTGLMSSASASSAGAEGSASGSSSGSTTIAVPVVEQIVDGPSMMIMGNGSASTDHWNEYVMAGGGGGVSFFCDWIVASTIHPNGALLLCALKCQVGWVHDPTGYFMLDCFWSISGPVPATVYCDGSNVCVDTVQMVEYMGMEYPNPVTICSSSTIYDGAGSLYVDLSGEARVGDSVIVSGNGGAASLEAGTYAYASGEDSSNLFPGFIVNGLCWMQLGDFVPE